MNLPRHIQRAGSDVLRLSNVMLVRMRHWRQFGGPRVTPPLELVAGGLATSISADRTTVP
jgi:hypothetical protein